MSQPRRRRRRRRRSGGGGSDQQKRQPGKQAEQSQEQPTRMRRTRRRRGRRGRQQERESSSPSSSEDLVRRLPQDRPKTLSAPPDGQDLETIIGELQSVWGVPQYPQEYRITIKVADERDGRGEQAVVVEEASHGPEEGRAPGDTEMPVREKAPAAPLMRSRREGGVSREKAPRRRRRRGRRRGGGGSS